MEQPHIEDMARFITELAGNFLGVIVYPGKITTDTNIPIVLWLPNSVGKILTVNQLFRFTERHPVEHSEFIYNDNGLCLVFFISPKVAKNVLDSVASLLSWSAGILKINTYAQAAGDEKEVQALVEQVRGTLKKDVYIPIPLH